MRPGGYPFVHALDTVNASAHCIGLPWTYGKQDALLSMRMALIDDESKLAVNWGSGKRWLAIDSGTWRITHPGSGGFAWRWPLLAAGALGLAVAAALLARRRLHAHEEALPQPL
jgi:hypothetical protein